MIKNLFTYLGLLSLLFLTSTAFGKIVYPTGISLSGAGTYCQGQSPATLTIPNLTAAQCGGNGSAPNVTHTTTIYSNVVNSTSGGTQVATLTNSLFRTNSSYVLPTATCGTMYYYAVVSWSAQDCAAGSITSSVIAVTIDCSFTATGTNASYTTCGKEDTHIMN